ncbi:Cytochrome P450 9e2, partial [Habropoda laboriosa]
STMWTIILALSAVALAAYYLSGFGNPFKKHGIPYRKSLPIVGCSWDLFYQRETVADIMQYNYNLHKDAKYVVYYEFMQPVFVIRDIELIKSITVKNFEHFVNHQTLITGDSDLLFSKNLFILKDDEWRNLRNAASPTFTTSKIKSMFVLMNDCAKRYGELLSKLPDDKKVLELKDVFTRCTNDIIASCTFGINVDSMTDRENKFYVYGRQATNFGRTNIIKFFMARHFPFLYKLFRIKIVDPKIEKFFMDVVTENIKTRVEKGISRPDMIQLLMETKGKELTVEDIISQVFIFYVGGLENVSTMMCFAAHEVGINPKIQKKLQDEIDDALAKNDGEITYEAMNGMKYLDAVVNETLRHYPIAAVTDRKCTKRVCIGNRFVVEEGSYIQIPIYGLQHDSQYFENPDTFDPERFMDKSKKFNSGAYLPFGLGPRVCIGNRFALLKTKVLLFHLFAKCTLKPCEKTRIPLQLTRSASAMIAEDGYWFQIEPRREICPVHVHSDSGSKVY